VRPASFIEEEGQGTGGQALAPDAALLVSQEKAVTAALARSRRAKAGAGRRGFHRRDGSLRESRAPIDAFFDKVTVNVTDKPELRLNRLKLLNQIRATMDSVADFSKIEG
jgi:glycyl-tRNA synthetase beta chain